MRDALKIYSCSNKNMELQTHKYVIALILNTSGLYVLKFYCYSKEVCVFVALHFNN